MDISSIFNQTRVLKIYYFSKIYFLTCNQIQQQVVINIIIKMKDDTFLNNLIDFKDLKLSCRNQNIENEHKSRDSFQSKNSLPAAQLDIDINNNDKLLRNFKQLRQQLKQATKTSHKLRTKLEEKQTEIERLKLNERDYITQNHQLKNKIDHLKSANEDSKAKLNLMKTITKQASQSEEEIQFLKITVSELKNKVTMLENQRNKILEISIVEKVELEEKIKKFQSKKCSDIQYVQDMQIQVSKLKQKCIKLQNQLKKMQIKYDEQIYNKQWSQGSFQKEHLQEQLRQLEFQNEEMLSKHKKQKQKRCILQKRVLELEQAAGLWVVKAQTYQSENKMLQKKFKQMQKKNEQIKEQSNRKISEVLTLQQKFAKSISIADQLISRVKRELIGDIVALAKSCEFKLGKLKDEKQGFFKNIQIQQMRKSTSDLKARSKSKQKYKIQQKQQQYDSIQKPQLISNLRQKFEQCYPSRTHTESNDPYLQREKQAQKQAYNTPSPQCQYQSHQNKFESNPLSQIDNIQVRIKKQRDEMEKKIREKMLYRKLEVANSPEKYQLREDYFRLFEN